MLKKIKDFLNKVFGRKQNKLIEAAADNIIEKNEINNFKDELKLENNEEYRVLDLQSKLKNGEIKVEEMDESDKDALILLYIKDIKEQLKRLNA